MDPLDDAAIAADLIAHRTDRRTRLALTSERHLTLDDAYRIQALVTSARLGRGERVVGWKLGYTSQAMRQQMGIAEPNYGPITDAMTLASPATASAALMQPRVEPEIAMTFERDLVGEVTVDEVLAATAYASACLEVVDSVYTGYRFRIEDNTADGSSAAQVVLGPRLRSTDALADMRVDLYHDDTLSASATGAAASGHPALGVVWLVRQLAATGRRLSAGEFVITGGLTAAVPVEPGDRVTAVFDGTEHVSVRR